MTKEETKKVIEIMQAYVDGKQIQCINFGDGSWYDVNNPSWDFECCQYRIKPESKIRPYNCAKEFLQAQKKHGMYLKIEKSMFLPVHITEGFINILTLRGETHSETFNYTYIKLIEEKVCWCDGTPCGIMEE